MATVAADTTVETKIQAIEQGYRLGFKSYALMLCAAGAGAYGSGFGLAAAAATLLPAAALLKWLKAMGIESDLKDQNKWNRADRWYGISLRQYVLGCIEIVALLAAAYHLSVNNKNSNSITAAQNNLEMQILGGDKTPLPQYADVYAPHNIEIILPKMAIPKVGEVGPTTLLLFSYPEVTGKVPVTGKEISNDGACSKIEIQAGNERPYVIAVRPSDEKGGTPLPCEQLPPPSLDP